MKLTGLPGRKPRNTQESLRVRRHLRRTMEQTVTLFALFGRGYVERRDLVAEDFVVLLESPKNSLVMVTPSGRAQGIELAFEPPDPGATIIGEASLFVVFGADGTLKSWRWDPVAD